MTSSPPVPVAAEPRVTVLMGVHDGAPFVGSAIESIVRQTHAGWELIVVDDGSTDSSLAILHSWARRDGRIRVVEHPRRLGLAACLNDGFAQARGELIARLDADDVSAPDRLAKQVAFLDSHPDIAVVGSGAEFVDSGGRGMGNGFLFEQHDDIAANIYRTSPFIHPSVMMRRSFLESLGGYDVRLRRAQDADLWLRGYRRYRYHNLPQPLVRCRIRDNGGVDASVILSGGFVLARAAYRERRLLSRGGYAIRFVLSTLLVKAGLRDRRTGAAHARRP
jgi:glycosyltransferase involved in cell wall biosynthesis